MIIADRSSDNTGYRYYRYYNETSHGDVAEVEFYGVSVSGIPEAKAAEAEAAGEQTDAAAPVTAAQTADIFGVALIALAGASVIIFKKRR